MQTVARPNEAANCTIQDWHQDANRHIWAIAGKRLKVLDFKRFFVSFKIIPTGRHVVPNMSGHLTLDAASWDCDRGASNPMSSDFTFSVWNWRLTNSFARQDNKIPGTLMGPHKRNIRIFFNARLSAQYFTFSKRQVAEINAKWRTSASENTVVRNWNATLPTMDSYELNHLLVPTDLWRVPDRTGP